MRLIDADKLMQFLYEKKDEEEQHLGIESDVSVMIGSIGFEVMNTPTAYDIDKVVEELKDTMAYVENTSDIVWNNAIRRAIEIVKSDCVNK